MQRKKNWSRPKNEAFEIFQTAGYFSESHLNFRMLTFVSYHFPLMHLACIPFSIFKYSACSRLFKLCITYNGFQAKFEVMVPKFSVGFTYWIIPFVKGFSECGSLTMDFKPILKHWYQNIHLVSLIESFSGAFLTIWMVSID